VSKDNAAEYLMALMAMGAPTTKRVLLQTPEDIPQPIVCTEKNPGAIPGEVSSKVRPPLVQESDAGFLMGVIYTWHDRGGYVAQNRFLIWPDGRVMIRQQFIASAVGAHQPAVRIVK
jgi:hypothetical protein